MTQLDLEVLLSTIGKSGTNEAREADEKARRDRPVRYWLLSGFVVGGRVEVRTRHWHAPEMRLPLGELRSADYTITPCTLQHIGTEVTIFLRSAEDRGLLHDDAVKKVIRDYADMLRVSIRLNDPGHQTPPITPVSCPGRRRASLNRKCVLTR